MNIEYSLKMPKGWHKSTEQERFYSWSNIKISLTHFENIMKLLSAKDIVLTSNNNDSAVSVFFTLYTKRLCLYLDKWDRREDNITAISMFLENLIKSKKYVGDNIVLYCLSNLKENPTTLTSIVTNIKKPLWCNILEVEETCTKEEVKTQYHKLCKIMHPDNGGSADEFILLKQAYDEGMLNAK